MVPFVKSNPGIWIGGGVPGPTGPTPIGFTLPLLLGIGLSVSETGSS